MTQTLAIPAGDLREKVTIQAATRVNQDDGTVAEVWGTANPDDPTRRVKIESQPRHGREYFEAQQMKAGVTHQITMRPWPGLTPRHRLLFGNRVFNIVSARDIDERGIRMEVLCKEEV